ncbi:hypothetical protein DL96DRAFT_1553804 [Flagelloscypha sp. PMI_526]|nr:hypothetical protein DL96DRAFT_1553804 [Flagelloscypha sp. PMI_526]
MDSAITIIRTYYSEQNAKHAFAIDELLDTMSQSHPKAEDRSLAVNAAAHYALLLAIQLLQNPLAARLLEVFLVAVAGLFCVTLVRRVIRRHPRISTADIPSTTVDILPKTPRSSPRLQLFASPPNNSPFSPVPFTPSRLSVPPSPSPMQYTPKAPGARMSMGERKKQPRATNAEEEDLIKAFERERLELLRSVARPTRTIPDKENDELQLDLLASP